MIIVHQDRSITSLPADGTQVLSEVGRLQTSGLLGSKATRLRKSPRAERGGTWELKQGNGKVLGSLDY